MSEPIFITHEQNRAYQQGYSDYVRTEGGSKNLSILHLHMIHQQDTRLRTGPVGTKQKKTGGREACKVKGKRLLVNGCRSPVHRGRA
jgi:hypothetical protein